MRDSFKRSQPKRSRREGGIPRWVFIGGIVLALLAVMFAVVMVVGGRGGGHGPGRHMNPGGDHTPPSGMHGAPQSAITPEGQVWITATTSAPAAQGDSADEQPAPTAVSQTPDASGGTQPAPTNIMPSALPSGHVPPPGMHG